jgi:hypothetical protein
MPPPPSYRKLKSLAERFRELMYGGMSPADAVERLAELYYAFHFHISDPLPADVLYSLLFVLGPGDELEVRLLDGRRLDPEKTLTREPHMLEVSPVPLDQYRWMSADPRQAERDALDAMTIDAPQPAAAPEPEPLPAPEAEPPPSTDGRELVVWKETLIPLLNTLRDANQLPNKTAAFNAVNNCLIGRGQSMARSSIYEGLTRHHKEWWPPPAK